jgi:outer membrane protein OmpA-like peptidoglycan-associated protein
MIMGRGMSALLVLCAPIVLASGCTSVSQMLFAKQEAEIDERFVGIERRVDDQGGRLTTLVGRVTALETSAEQTGDMAKAARDRANIAMARLDSADGSKRSAPAQPGPKSPVAQESVKVRALLGVVHVRFAFNRADLDDGAEKALASVLKELKDNPTLTIDLEGSTDSKGARDYNVQLSQRRVEAVRRFLLARGVESPRVVQSSGVGALQDGSVPEDQKRRVAVKLMQVPE